MLLGNGRYLQVGFPVQPLGPGGGKDLFILFLVPCPVDDHGAAVGRGRRRHGCRLGPLLLVHGWEPDRHLQMLDAGKQLLDILRSGQVIIVLSGQQRGLVLVQHLVKDQHSGSNLGGGPLKGHCWQGNAAAQVKALDLLVELVQPLVRRRTFRHQDHNAAAVPQVLYRLGQVGHSRGSAGSERRIHDNKIILIVRVQLLECPFPEHAAGVHRQLAGQHVARLNKMIAGVAGKEAGNGAMAGGRLQPGLAGPRPGPLHHLHGHRFGGGKVVRTLPALLALALFAAGIVISPGPGKSAHPLKIAILVLAALPLSRTWRRLCGGQIAFLERGVQITGRITHGQVFHGAHPGVDLGAVGGLLERSMQHQILHNGVRLLPHPVDSPLALDGGRWAVGQAQIHKHPRMLAGHIVQAVAFLAGGPQHHDHIHSGTVLIETADILRALPARHPAVVEHHPVAEGLGHGGNGRL